MKFNSDGSLQVPDKKAEDVELFVEETPKQAILQLLTELRFPIGKKLFAETITGKIDSKIRKLSLDTCGNYGALDLHDPQDIYNILDELIFDEYIQVTKTPKTKYFPVLEITSKGKKELANPNSTSKTKDFVRTHDVLSKLSEITPEDKQLFTAFGDYLSGFNDEQKKAIIAASKHILCIAGAGSGKTTVLTKRIDFLIRMRGVDPSKILAITFTRKARQEMMNRLPNIPVHIETFNSFCEKLLKKHGALFYDREVTVMNFSNRLKIFNKALSRMSYGVESAVDKYFSTTRGRDEKSLYFTLVSDMYGLIDHYKNNETPISEFKNIIGHCTVNDKARAMFVYRLVENIIAITKEMGFRDYTDQLVHSLTLLSQHPELITQYEHILVDEYQDVNDIQVKLLGVLQPKNLFVVGDPRQSIYGWRGSKIKHIMKFPEEHEDCAVVQLTKNYRSTEDIVRVSNSIIKPMHLPDLISNSEKTEKKPLLLKHKDEASELQFIAQSILACDVAPNDIFVLARTNKQLEKMKEELARHGISFLIRTAEDQKQDMNPTEEQITLSTVHAIKGLEAKLVYLIGVTSKMYPCLVSDHPVIDMAKLDTSYDKEDEELRLLYVAMTRAKEQLVVNYYGSLSKFVSKEVKQLFSVVDNTIGMRVSDVSGTGVGASSDLMTRLKEWRMQVARQSNVLPYMVLPDRVFLQLITMKPSSIAQLHDINGLGPTKIMHYGNDLLDIINGF